MSSKRTQDLPFNGHLFIQLFESCDFYTPKIELNRMNSLRVKEIFSNEELDDFELFTWKLEKVQYIKIFLLSEDDVEDMFLKFIVLNTPDKKKL